MGLGILVHTNYYNVYKTKMTKKRSKHLLSCDLVGFITNFDMTILVLFGLS